MVQITNKDKKRFWDKVAIADGDECWEWTACKGRGGYGVFRWNGKNKRSHRFAWEIANNAPIPEGMYICHSCDNPSCVNPKHLFVGTPSDNERDCWTKGRKSLRGERHSHNKLTREQVIIVKRAIAETEFDYGDKREFCRYWGKKFNVGMGAIKHILYEDNWTHIKV